MQIEINNRTVSITGVDAEVAINSSQFKDWVSTLDPRFIVRAIEFQSVDIFLHGDTPVVRFIKFKADVVDQNDKPFAGVVFMRGGSVVILVILECDGVDYTILTTQPRFPSGIFEFPEIPAGTMENDGNFFRGAVRELFEETGIQVKKEELVDLVEVVHGDKFKGIFSTVGGSDEFFRVFLFQTSVSREFIEELQGKRTGLESENEQIKLRIIPFSDLPFVSPDAKALTAMALYSTAKSKGKI